MTRIICFLAVLMFVGPLLSHASTATVSFASTTLSPVNDKASPTPFSDVTVSDTDSVDFDPVQITFPTSHGTLSLGTPYSLILTNGVYLMSRSSMSASQAQSGLRAIVYNPVENRIPMGTVETNAFTVTVADINGSSDSATVNLPVTPANDAPTLTLPSSVTGIDDTETTLPFAAISIGDVDSNDTVTVEIRFPDVRGVLTTNANFVKTISGGTAIYTLNSRSPASAETYMKTVVFTPAENRIPIGTTESTIFTAKVTDAASSSASDTVSVTVTPVNDAPLFSGGIRTPVNDNIMTNLFAGFTITDVDNNGTQLVVVTASVGGSGESGVGSFTNSSGLFREVSFTNTPAAVSSSLQGLLFSPVPNRQPVGSNETVVLSVDVEDVSGLSSPSNRTYTVTVISINDPPSIVPSLASVIADNVDSQPFDATVTDDDFLDDQHLTVSVTLTNPADAAVGMLSPTNVVSGTKDYVETALRGLTFVPVRNSVSGSRVLAFQFTAFDAHGGQGSAVASLTIQGQNDTPDISGVAPSLLRMTDDANDQIYPFSAVLISDPDGGQILTVTLSLDNTAKGVFSKTSLTGTPTEVTAAIRDISFKALRPSDRVVGQTVNVTLTITVTDSGGATRANSGTVVAITSVNGAPRIEGVPLIQPVLISPAPPVRPFAGVSVTDDETNAITVKVILDNPDKGTFTNLGGFVATVPGTYQVVTNHEAASTALSNLAFVASESFVFPANAPGGTVFTIRALDSVLNLATKTVSIVLQYEPRNVFVTRTADDALPGSLRYAVSHCENNGFITFALPSYPATIQLNAARGPIELMHNVNFRGPGADRLTISGDSNGDGLPEVQLFRIRASVTMEGITLTKGLSADTGGACYVGAGGALSLRYCAVTESVASQWGGGIDVDEGSLSLEGCLIRSNRTSETLGLGGGGISLYTDEPCSFVNSTFSGNRQQSGSGIAGGALYVENLTPSTELDVQVRHCTFAGNEDMVGDASAIMALGFGTSVDVGNSVFMDGQGRNLGVDGAGDILSDGGNLSDDSTRTTLIQGGVPEEVVLLGLSSDLTSVSSGAVLEMPLALDLRPTAGYRLKAGSPAIGHAVAPKAAVDQLGVLRDGAPDSGAVEYDRTARVVLNEIQFDPEGGQPTWLEFYVPRDSSPVDFGGLMLRVDGVTNHIFSSPLVCQPGHGLIVAGTNGTVVLSPTNNPIPVLTPSVANFTIKPAGTIELVNPAQGWMTVQRVTYLGVFADPVSPTQTFACVHNSITLAPQFNGSAYVPHSLVLPPPQGGADVSRTTTENLSSPGSDTSPMAFGSRNAMPQAQADRVVVGEDDLSVLAVLANDTDADGRDRLVILDLSPSPLSPADRSQTNSTQGAEIQLNPAAINDAGATPKLRGTAVIYDPRHTDALQSLPEGAKITDSFCYALVDIGSGPIDSYRTNGASTVVDSPGHRLTNNEEIVISGCSVTNYNGNWMVTPMGDDAFSIPVLFAGAPVTNGSWVTRNQRQGTAYSQTTVEVDVLGANDYPVPGEDAVPVDEDTVFRVMADAALAGATGLVFETDAGYPMRPVISGTSLLTNDLDPDTDDDATTLNLVGVLGQVHAITNYEGSAGIAPVVVRSPGHGLSDGTVILISGYSGHPSYNGYQAVTVVDADTFTIPVRYVDNAATKGCWGLLTDAGRLVATSEKGASVRLDLRAQRTETSVLYDPTHSDTLNQLAVGETGTDTFYCAVSDRHGAVSLGRVTMLVAGRNDVPVAHSDPGTLASLIGWPGSDSMRDLLAQLSVVYVMSPASHAPQHADVRVQAGTNGTPWVTSLADIWFTDEDTPISIDAAGLLANDSDVDFHDQLVIASIVPGSTEGASLALGSNGVAIVYDPTTSSNLNSLARNESRIDSFNAIVSDQHGGMVTSLVAVLVIGRDDSPRAHDDTASVFENQRLTLAPPNGVMANDEEDDINGATPDNRPVVIDQTNRPTQIPNVWVAISNNTVFYNPTESAFLKGLAAGQTFGDEVAYMMMDGSFVFANQDVFKVRANGSNVVLEVLANDRNFTGSGGSLRITAVGAPSQGGQCVGGNGNTNLVYTPTPGFVGDEVVLYTIDDGMGNSDRAQVLIRVTVNRLNGDLLANADSFAVAKGETVSLDVLGNDNILPEGGTNLVLVGMVMAPTAGGQAVITSNRVVFTPDSAHSGVYPYTEQFSYAVSGGGSVTATGLVDILVVNREGTLEVRDDAFSVDPGSLGTPLDVLLNDTILPGLPVVLTVRAISRAAHGQVTRDGDGRGVTYVPDSTFIGLDTFGYVATDGLGGTGTGMVVVTVGSLTACGDTFVVTNLSPMVELDVLANDMLLQETLGANLVIASVAPSNTLMGPVGIKPGGKRLLFGPVTQVGEQDCIYTLTDGFRTASASVHLVVISSGIKANPDVYAAVSDSVGNGLDVLRNDITVPSQGKTLTIASVGTGANAPNHGGTVTVSGDAYSLIYTPAPEFSGEETFTYTMTDSSQSDTAKVVVKVTRGEMMANPDRFSVFMETPEGGADPQTFVLPVTANDVVVPDFGQALSIVSLGNGTNAPDHQGLVTISGDGQSLMYVPRDTNAVSGYTERFTYEISDGSERRAQAVVSVRVLNRTNAVDIATQDDAFAVERDSQNNVLPVMANDGVKPASTTGWTLTAVSSSVAGGVVGMSGNSVRYTPPAGFVGLDHFTYGVLDGFGGTGAAEVTVKVGGLVLNDDFFTVISGSDSNVMDVLVNDSLKPGTVDDYHLLEAGGTTSGGTVGTLDGKVVYSPLAGYAGPWPYSEEFFYRVADDSGVLSTGKTTVTVYRDGADRSNAVLRINVVGVNDPPVITGTVTGQRYYLQGIKPFSGVTISDVDRFGSELQTVTVTLDNPGHGTLTSLGSFSAVSNGVITLTGVTPVQASAALRQLVFMPIMDANGPGGGLTTRLMIAVYDGTVTTTDTNTTLIDSAAVEALVLAGNVSSNANFGSAVAASSNLVIAGMANDVSNGASHVSASFLVNSGSGTGSWSSIGKVMSIETQSFVYGVSAAIEGDTLVVGAPSVMNGSLRSGAAYVYTRNQGGSNHWGLVATLTAFDGATADEFGNYVAISGDTIVVGALRDQVTAVQSGSIYLFGRNQGGTNQWGLIKKIAPAEGTTEDLFGCSVAIVGDTLAVGTPKRDDKGFNAGAVYVYMRDTGGSNQWGQALKIYASDASALSQFGFAVGMHDEVLAVGAPYESVGGTNSGALYLFSRNQGGTNQWGQIKKIRPSTAIMDQEFGFSVSLDGSWLAVGARSDKESGIKSGSAYLYARNYAGVAPWGLVQKFSPHAGAVGDEFGYAISVGGGVLAVGARYHSVPMPLCGATHIYELKFNNAPEVANPVPNQTAVVGHPFGLILPLDTFADPDVNDTLSLAADYSLSPGLGSWLSFDPVAWVFGGTPTTPGTYTIRLRAHDQEGAAVTNQFVLTVVSNGVPAVLVTPLDQWRDLFFGAAVLGNGSLESSLWGNQADADGDGVPNLTEYLFGTNPRLADGIDPSRVSLAPMSGSSQWVGISFRRRSQDWYLNYSLEVSSNLVVWQPVGALVLDEDVVPLSPGVDLVTQYVLIPGVSANRQFYRLKATVAE